MGALPLERPDGFSLYPAPSGCTILSILPNSISLRMNQGGSSSLDHWYDRT